jgi:hypothetical protein
MEQIIERRRLASPCVTPQALAFSGRQVWLSSRDLGRLYRMEAENWRVMEEIEPPGVVWAAVSLGEELRLTIGEGADDDRFVYRYTPQAGFEKLFACPEFAGSYLSFDGEHLYLSQWYNQRILKLDPAGKILGEIKVGAEVCGHVFARGSLYVLRGVEKPEEAWRMASVDLRAEAPVVTDLVTVPFASRSLAFDGENFWSNHRAANETVEFALPR